MTVSIVELKAKASEIVARAEKGECVTITRNGKPVARIQAPPDVDERAALRVRIEEKFAAMSPLKTSISPDEIISAIHEGRR